MEKNRSLEETTNKFHSQEECVHFEGICLGVSPLISYSYDGSHQVYCHDGRRYYISPPQSFEKGCTKEKRVSIRLIGCE